MSNPKLNEQLQTLAGELTPDHVAPYRMVARRRRRRIVRRRATLSAATVVVVGLGLWGYADLGGSTRSVRPGFTAAETKVLLTQSSWTLVSVDQGGTAWKPPAGVGTLKLTNTTWVSSDGANQHEGSASFGAGTVHLSAGDSSLASQPSDPQLKRLAQVSQDDLEGDLIVDGTATSMTLSGHGVVLHYLGKPAVGAATTPAPAPSN